ncbi:MAG: exodeoxyribonuclease VII large subunit [Deltaproteobacteria bacterium]|jgi:exodeoxyribonuclease VII large subunit|nr:exodeoxyribonuclease VII large subunit [Deltaproteobacteria bacterium]
MSYVYPDNLTPTTVAAMISLLLDEKLSRVTVEGEMTGVYRAPSGHSYFSLKDPECVLNCVMWKRSHPEAIEHLMANGLKVLAWGKLACYGPRSVYQLIVDHLEPRGEGALKRAYELLKKKLEAEGLFREERKRPLPAFPGRVALITARHGAAAGDFLRTALRRFPGAAIALFSVRVQGDEAADEMVRAISAVNLAGGFDVIVLTRGGGSAEDLWAFNEEPLIRAVAGSRVPVLAAVGHSKDLSLAELAADRRAITPTAAAEAVFPDARAASDEAKVLGERLARAVGLDLRSRRDLLAGLDRRALAGLERRIAGERAALSRLGEAMAGGMRLRTGLASAEADRLRTRLLSSASQFFRETRGAFERLADKLAFLTPADRAARLREGVESGRAALSALGARLLSPYRTELERASERLRLLSPLAVLERGYSIATDSEGRIIRRAADVSPGDTFRLLLGEGALAAKVTSREEGGSREEG